MPLKPSETANFGKSCIVVNTDFQIRVVDGAALEIESIGEPEYARVAAKIERYEMQVAIRFHPRHGALDVGPQIRDQPAQAHEIAFVKRHQAHETAGRGTPRGNTQLIGYHEPTIPCSLNISGTQPTLHSGPVQYSAGHLLDRTFGRVDERNPMSLEQRLGGPHLECHLRRRRVAAVRAPFVANLLQSIRRNRQTE